MTKDSSGVVLITGAAHRIGRGIARDLAKAGWAVAAHYWTSKDEAESLVAEIRDDGGTAMAVAADLMDEASVDTLIPAVAGGLGPVTCLINNASTFERDEVEDATRESWDRHMETNLRAPFVLSQAVARQLPQGGGGNIINILDQRVWNLTPHFVSYTLSKAGLWTLTQTLALALAPAIRVNGIGPGPTLPSPRQDEAQFRRQYEGTPLRRQVSVGEICGAVRFVLASPSMTGQMIALDSGQHLGWASPRGADMAEE